MRLHRNPGPFGDDMCNEVLVDFFLQQAIWLFVEALFSFLDFFFELLESDYIVM